jgi:hypothetical protein
MAIKASNYVIIRPNHDLYNRLEIIRSHISGKQLQVAFLKANTIPVKRPFRNKTPQKKSLVLSFVDSKEKFN